MIKKIIFLFILVFISPVSAFADELVLEKGKGVEVCEAYQKSLKGLSLQEMVCGEKTETETIKRPKWERMELRENKELVKRIEKFLSYGDQFAKEIDLDDEKIFEKELNEFWVESKEYPAMRILYVVKVDIDNDGKAEKVLRYSKGLCMESHVYARPLLILNADKNLINPEKTEPLLQNLFGKDIKGKVQDHFYQLYDIFFYRDKTYFDKWNLRDLTLTVYKLSKNQTKGICKYKHEQTFKNKKGNHEN